MNKRKETKSKLSVADKIIKGLKTVAVKLESEEKTDVVFDQFNCRRFVLDLKPVQFDSTDVKRLREELQVSQSIFASLIGVSVKTVQAWEQGKNPPQQVASRFMDEIQTDLEYWKKKLAKKIRPSREPVNT